MNKRTRLWSVLLTLSLLLTMLPTTALAGGLSTVKTYAELVAALASQTGEIYLEPAADFGWPAEATLTIPANVRIEVETGKAWEIPSGITVNFDRNCRGIQCDELTINGTMHTASSSQDSLFSRCDKVIIGPTGTFTCENDMEGQPTVCGQHIPAGKTWEVQSGATLNPRVRLDGTLTGKGTVSGQVRVIGGFNGTASNATLSGNLTLTGELTVGRENSGYADQLTIPAGSHIKRINSGTTISHASVYLNGVMEWEKGEYSANSSIAAGGKIVMDGGKLIFNTPCLLRQAVFDWGNEEVMTYEKVRENIPEPLIDGTGIIRFNDQVSATGEEYGRIMDCDADLVALTAQQVRAGTYVVENARARTWEPYYAIDLMNIDIERSWACDHTWDDGVVTTKPTCTQPGEKTYTCTQCQTTRTEEIEAKGHTAVTDAAVAATCTETGLTEGSHCSVCDVVLVEQTVIPALGHAWSTNNCAEEATCTREGCDATRAAGEHVWGDWTVTKDATCTEAGSRTHTCTSCKVEASEAITALGHSYSSAVTAPTCTEKGYTTHTCSRCGDSYKDTYVDALGHDWGEWVVDKEATGTEDGSRHRNCSRCDAVDTEVISMLEKQKVSWTIPDTITWTYGQVNGVQNTANNDTADGGALTYSSSDESVATVDADGKATIVGAGTATITVTAAKVDSKYAETSASYTLIINKASLTVTANNHTITYGQAPAGNGWTADGLKYNDTQSVVTGTAAYTYSYEQYGNAGSYAINVSGLTAKNYDITFAPGTLTVSKASDYTITLGNLTQRDDDITDVTASITPQDATAQIKVEYQVDGNWTTSLPTAAGEYQIRASLTGSSNIQADGEYTTGTLTIQRSIGVDGTDVTVTVDEGKANITVTEGELADIVDNADGDVSINLGGVEGVDELVLPGSLLEALSESDKADSLTITTEDTSISMSGAVLDTVASAVTGEDTVAVKLSAVEKEDLNEDQKAALNSITQDAVIVEVSLVITHADGTETELHQLGGNVEVTVPYAGGVPEGKYIVVCYLSDDGNVTYVRATYNAETKQVTFTTNHFSNYAVFVSGDPAVVVDGGSGSGLYTEGETVTIKADSKSGYTFAGWEIVSGGITLTDSKATETTFTMPAANVELRATYTRNSSGGGGGGGVSTYTLTFDTNGGSKIDSVSRAGGAAIDLTGYVPTRAGYDFAGWYSDAKLTDKVTSVKLTKNMTVYAKWTEKGGENPFTDVANDAYYADAVIWAVGKGITSGTTATTFTPNTPCTRAQAVTFLWRAAGSPEPAGMSSFADVPADGYYAKAVAWAVEQGITKGTSDTTFSPNATCTRAQIVTFLWRSQKSPVAGTVNPFTDVAADAYYANAVLWAAENGITGGTTATTFSPNANCTRAQIVTFLFRCLGGK